MARVFFCLLVLVLSTHPVVAQDFPIHVRWINHGPEDRFSDLNTEIASVLQSELQWRGVPTEGQGMELFFRAEELPTSAGNLIVLSLIESQALTQRVVDAGARHQIWYAGLPQPENVEEARFVREYMTREILSSQVQITNIVQLAFSRTEISAAVSNYLDDYFERIRCADPDHLCS